MMRGLVARPGPGADLLVRAARIVDPRERIDAPLDVLVREGVIAELGPPGALVAPAGTAELEATGCLLVPAFVDPHVHLRTPGQEHKEDLESGTAAAAAGGYGQLIAMPNTDPVVDAVPVLNALLQAAHREAHVPVGFLAAATVGQRGQELAEMAALRDAGALGFTDDGWPIASARIVRRALQYQRLCGGVLALHEEDPALSGRGVMHEGEVAARLGMSGIPSISESTMVARDVAIARYEQGRIHLQHLSCAESVEALAAAKAAGVAVSAEVTPHHLTLTDREVLTLDTRLKMNPPLRGEDDRRALVAALLDGTIDCVATDHAPHTREEKEVPWEEAPMGTTGLETAWAALHTALVVPGTLPLALLVERMTAGGALFGLPAPRIAPEAPAELCLIDPDAEWEVGELGYRSRAQNCCFHGRRLRGRVLLTVAGGRIAHRAAALCGHP